MRNMPREVLNLGEKRYVESLFTNGKSHLRNDRIKKILIIHSPMGYAGGRYFV